MDLKNRIKRLGFAVFIIGILGILAYGFIRSTYGENTKLMSGNESRDAHARLLLEIFDSVKKNYWEKTDDEKLMRLFELAVKRVATTSPVLASTTPEVFADYLADSVLTIPEAGRRDAALAIGELVLNNLSPFGRSHIFTTTQEKELRNNVSNINPDKDLYASLGVTKDASKEAIQKEYELKVAELKKEKTPEAEGKIQELAYAKEVLTNTAQKELYDTKKIEPTLFLKSLSPSTLYLNLTKFSPTTVSEFADTAKKLGSYPKARNLIIDMRGNIGGSFDIVPYLSGFFIGQGQYAFDLFKQGEYIPFKTPTAKLPELSGLKRVIVLIDGATQSSAELFTSVLKKYNKAIAVGTHSKGWGTIENTFPLATTLEGSSYSLFLVHSITLREDGQPIEGRGVDPDIDIGDKDWKAKAITLFEDSALVKLVEQTLKNRP